MLYPQYYLSHKEDFQCLGKESKITPPNKFEGATVVIIKYHPQREFVCAAKKNHPPREGAAVIEGPSRDPDRHDCLSDYKTFSAVFASLRENI